jgi:nucleoside-diphosphate-sugar epimerase
MLDIKKPLIIGSRGVVGTALYNQYLPIPGIYPVEFDISISNDMDLTKGTAAVQSCIDACDFVFFLAYDVGGAKFLDKNKNNIALIQNNCRMMDNVFEALKGSNKPFIFASSQMSNMLHSSYGVCKAIGEHYTNALGGKFVKFWNVYGPEYNHEKAHVITDFINIAHKTGRINMLTDGNESRQFLHTTDCSKCLITLASKYDELEDMPLDITSFRWTAITEIAHIIAKMIPGTAITSGLRQDMTQNDMRNEPDKYILNLWKPEMTLEDGIGELINEYTKRD